MASNYYTEVSDVLTDAFDVKLAIGLKKIKSAKSKRTAKKLAGLVKRNTDAQFRANYQLLDKILQSLQ